MKYISTSWCRWCGAMSPSVYRRYVREVFGPLEKDVDVFHIIASANGGADHPDNYDFVRGRGFNRMIGASHDQVNCFLAGKAKCTKAVAISSAIGSYNEGHKKHKKYVGPSAVDMYFAGEEFMRSVFKKM